MSSIKRGIALTLLLILAPGVALLAGTGQPGRVTINLNGTWEFDQTTVAFPPAEFTRTCPVPGLVHLATPRIEDYDAFFKRPDKPVAKDQYDLTKLDYTPRYSWYRKMVTIPAELEGRDAVLTILKSQYVTQVIVNGIDVGTSMECYTPIEFPVGDYLKYGQPNEILLRVGDRIWLPSQAAGGTDKEKEHYLPGIWDDVYLSFTGKIRANRVLLLPMLKEKKAVAKIQIRSHYPPQLLFGTSMYDRARVEIEVREKVSGKLLGSSSIEAEAKRDNLTTFQTEISLPEATPWTPDNPFLLTATVRIFEADQLSDHVIETFGMRDFGRQGRFFTLNGKRIYLRGTNITLQRFFEDPDASDLVWDREWVTELLGTIPKDLKWNAMRICVGIVPDFWYDIADEQGLMLQNEWLYWQNHGWDDQIRKEYTNWVWSDGNHPSIVIWDAINENTDPFIGNVLIPELKQLDPTRIWDAGFMTAGDMNLDEMDEPHPYRAGWQLIYAEDTAAALKKNPYPLGKLDYHPSDLEAMYSSSSAQLVNEYGWIWLWRDGQPSFLTKTAYDYFLGKDATPGQRRELQAYWLQLETEWLRSERSLAGVLAFCYLTNNYGYTGDWFTGNIRELDWAPTLQWFKHAFAPTAVFIDLADERYLPQAPPHSPGETLALNLVGINDLSEAQSGSVTLTLLDSTGSSISLKESGLTIPAFGKVHLPVVVTLPQKPGGYLAVAEYKPDNDSTKPVMSRRFLRIGEASSLSYPEIQP